MTILSLEELRAEALITIRKIEEGQKLEPVARALVALSVSISVTALRSADIRSRIAEAFDAGASVDQIEEVIALASGLGVHSLMASQVAVVEEASRRGLIDALIPLDHERQILWDKCVGGDPFWAGFSEHFPGFLDAMLRLSPKVFEGFFAYCAIPWSIGTVRARVKELCAMACDATPAHRFRPGFRLHLVNAIKLGAGRQEILDVLDIAASAPVHQGHS